MNKMDNIISEELTRMSNLFHYQAGKVISEQDNNSFADRFAYKPIGGQPTTLPQAKTRLQYIETAYCHVKNGIIDLPNSKINKVKWSDYVTKYGVKTEDLTQIKLKCPGINTTVPFSNVKLSSSTPPVSNTNTPEVKKGKQIVKQNPIVSATQQIQKSIGSKVTGQLSDAELTTILNRL